MATKQQGYLAVSELFRQIRTFMCECHEWKTGLLRASPSGYQELAECIVNLSEIDRDTAIDTLAKILPVIEGAPMARAVFNPIFRKIESVRDKF